VERPSTPRASTTTRCARHVTVVRRSERGRAGDAGADLPRPLGTPRGAPPHLLKLPALLRTDGTVGGEAVPAVRRVESQADHEVVIFLRPVYLPCESARTAKAPHHEKIKQLFNFFKDEHDNGIRFIDFTKMVPAAPLSSTTTPAMSLRRYSWRTST
jgi:hypothetical protein